jgi:hypothetical protein
MPESSRFNCIMKPEQSTVALVSTTKYMQINVVYNMIEDGVSGFRNNNNYEDDRILKHFARRDTSCGQNFDRFSSTRRLIASTLIIDVGKRNLHPTLI